MNTENETTAVAVSPAISYWGEKVDGPAVWRANNLISRLNERGYSLAEMPDMVHVVSAYALAQNTGFPVTLNAVVSIVHVPPMTPQVLIEWPADHNYNTTADADFVKSFIGGLEIRPDGVEWEADIQTFPEAADAVAYASLTESMLPEQRHAPVVVEPEASKVTGISIISGNMIEPIAHNWLSKERAISLPKIMGLHELSNGILFHAQSMAQVMEAEVTFQPVTVFGEAWPGGATFKANITITVMRFVNAPVQLLIELMNDFPYPEVMNHQQLLIPNYADLGARLAERMRSTLSIPVLAPINTKLVMAGDSTIHQYFAHLKQMVDTNVRGKQQPTGFLQQHVYGQPQGDSSANSNAYVPEAPQEFTRINFNIAHDRIPCYFGDEPYGKEHLFIGDFCGMDASDVLNSWLAGEMRLTCFEVNRLRSMDGADNDVPHIRVVDYPASMGDEAIVKVNFIDTLSFAEAEAFWDANTRNEIGLEWANKTLPGIRVSAPEAEKERTVVRVDLGADHPDPSNAFSSIVASGGAVLENFDKANKDELQAFVKAPSQHPDEAQ